MMNDPTSRTAARAARVASPLGRIITAALAILIMGSGTVSAQSPLAVDDDYSASSGSMLQVEAPGVMENDHDGNGEPPPPPTAIARQSTGVSHGVLVLQGDGSFDYTPDQDFFGIDTFTYFFEDGSATSNTATVTITVDGCEPGVAPTQWVCWVEQAFYAKAVELGLSTLVESFEDDLTWGAARSPATVPSVVSQGITWASNFSFNNITTGDGQVRSGEWGFYSLPHGDQSGALTDPVRDGFTGTAATPDSLLGVGGWIVASQVGSRIDFIVTHDGGATTTAPFPDHSLALNHLFFGFIDTAGFTSFEIVETDGKVNQPYFVFGDDFSLLTAGDDITAPQVLAIGTVEDTGDGVLSEGEATSAAIIELMVDFNETVQDLPGDTDPDDASNPANYLLFDDSGDGFDTVDCAGGVAAGDNPITVAVLSYVSGNPSRTRLEVNGGFSLPAASYRLLVCGTTSIVDWAGNVLDGNGDGTGGDDFVRNFDVTVTVNHPPVADPQSVSTPEDTALAITLTGSDLDGDPIAFFIATGPSSGVLSGSPPNVIYTPYAESSGLDSFTFEVEDDSLVSAPATVTIDVLPVNDPPVAYDQIVTTPTNVALPITLTGSDIEGDPLTFAVGPGPAHGLLTGTSPNLSYSATGGYTGPDSFTFTANDGNGSSPAATVSITVTAVSNPPVAVDDSSTTDEDIAISIAVLSNDDLGDEPTTITAVSQGAKGSVVIDPGATTVTYTPNPNTTGGDGFSYTITDVDLQTSTAIVSMTVTAINDAPIADAGADQASVINGSVVLDGSASFDVDGDPLTFAWSFSSVPVGSAATLSDATAVMPTFVVDLPGGYVIELIVSDGTLFSVADSVTISTDNSPPVADAGSDQTAFVLDTVTLDGSASSDVDGDPLTYAWTYTSVPSGSTVSLDDPTAVMPSFEIDRPGSYFVRLVVHDGTTFSLADVVEISTENSAPVADAGPDQSASVNGTVTLDGSGSYDPDGDFFGYTWSLTSVPAGSAATLSSTTAEMPTFVVDIPGLYVVQLIVFDGFALSDPDTVTIDSSNDPWTWFVATDGHDGNDCETALTACRTISEAVLRSAAGDLVNVARGIYLEHLVLNVDLTLTGEFQKGTVIDGGGSGVVIDISPATTVIMSHLEVTGGSTGGVANQGDLTLVDSWIHDNGSGLPATFGGLSNLGTALIDRVGITANVGDVMGGVSNAGDLEIRNSTISGNTGGVDNLPGATLELHYSTVAVNGSYGILVGGATSLHGSIVAGHTTANCDVLVTSLGHNLEDADSCGLQVGAGDLIGVDPLLAPLGFNGGFSPTFALTTGSPAIDAAENAGSPAADQRGVTRPLDGDLDGTATSDIGAFEFIPGIIFSDGFESGDTSVWGG